MITGELLIPIGVFAVILFSVSVIFLLTRSVVAHRTIVERLKQGGQGPVVSANTGMVSAPGQARNRLKDYFEGVAKTFGNLTKPKSEEELSRIQRDLFNIGYKSPGAAVIFFGVKVLCAISLSACLFFLKFFVPVLNQFHPILNIGLYLIATAAGIYLPNIWLRVKVEGRKEQILRGFPDALDMLVVCVEAGMGLDAAIDRVGEEMYLSNAAISEEFKLYNRELRVGKSRRDALKGLARRTGLEDVNSLVVLLTQTDKFGTSIAQALRTHSDFMRTQRFQRAEEKAAKLTVKLLFPLIFCIFPCLFIAILAPGFVQAYRMFVGSSLR